MAARAGFGRTLKTLDEIKRNQILKDPMAHRGKGGGAAAILDLHSSILRETLGYFRPEVKESD
jgi:hypothetical protein